MDPDIDTTTSADVPSIADRLAQATQSLADALSNLDGQFTSLHAKIDRIVAAVDDGELQAAAKADQPLRTRLAELEKANHDLQAQSAAARRKTLSPMVTALLAKEGVKDDVTVETPIVEKALAGLSIEQRIAVKSELARAGVLV